MKIDEYVKGKRFSDLSTDGYEWQKWCHENNAELERRLALYGLENCTLNGRILLEFAEEQNIPVTLDALFSVVNDTRYSGRLVHVPTPPAAPVPAPTVKSLRYTRRKLTQLTAPEMKALLNNSAIGDLAEVSRQINEILAATPSESTPYQGNEVDKLFQLGIRAESKKSDPVKQPTDSDRAAHELKLRQDAWDRESRKFDWLTVPAPGGRTNHAKTIEAQQTARQRLGPRPVAR